MVAPVYDPIREAYEQAQRDRAQQQPQPIPTDYIRAAYEQARKDSLPDTYWENPQHLARYYNAIKAAPPGAVFPDWLDTGAVVSAYEYLKQTRPGEEWEEWILDKLDPVRSVLKELQTPPADYSHRSKGSILHLP